MRLPPLRTWRFLFPLALSGLWLAPTRAQEVVTIPDEVSCPECRIDVERMFDLGGPGDTLNIVHANFLPMDSRGRVYYQSVYVPGLIQAFDREGKHIHTFGREGEGPGEFRGWAALFISPGDSLFTFDSSLYRLSVFSPDFEFVRSARIDPPFRLRGGFFREDGSLLTTAIDRRATDFGRPFHIVDRDGRVRRSFGEERGVITGNVERDLARSVGPSADGGFWATHVYEQYTIEHWGPGGELVEIFERHPDWAPKPDDPAGGPRDATGPPPSSIVANIQVDDEGLLWMLVWVPDEGWKEAFETSEDRPARHDYRDTIIEVLDPARGRVVARHRIDDLAIGFSAPGVMYTWDDRGVWDRLKIWRLSLHTNKQNGE
ncbi:MAG: hypothetical protein HKO65_07520 [Gemmatimonadetes bacterium]|nr:hypothetical protein [Gemmatimonadota bacterium]